MADISVWSHYGDTEVWLQANFLEPFPNFLQGLSEVTDFEVTDF
jgi:hypothetical protein